ncbi:1,4-alpha-glucan (glycogen) branching enzyme, GH-13-type [hydrothermal vent metagenome]|uniref:1,4-alpha-glucan branching enzyme n=1 Tax=hydrothermal vent metagenome TaxID=652676 RepID=A0A3B1AZR6_9ZZZZ
MIQTHAIALNNNLQLIKNACHHDPFSVLGCFENDNLKIIRVYLPNITQAFFENTNQAMTRLENSDFYEWQTTDQIPQFYQILWHDSLGEIHYAYDPYCFPAQISDYDLHLFSEGKHWNIYRILGAHCTTLEIDKNQKISGVRFATWAPNAERVSIIGDFNSWDGRCHPMRSRGASGVWELFIPGLSADTLYKFELRNRHTNEVLSKADPYGQLSELRPRTASVVCEHSQFEWHDNKWITTRQQTNWLHSPLSIYEVHLGSWQHDIRGEFLNYRELAHRLVHYVTEMGFTHIELLPITEHPLDASWGYQTTGYFAPTRRFGDPDDFRYFVDYCHEHNIGVFMDWAPGHFPKDDHGLANFDGSPLYEHADPRRGEHRDWGTLIYNYGRHEVKNFLIANAVYWLEEFHIDGLRVDAVASMLYLDYSREADDWIANEYGGNENLEAINFLRELNITTHSLLPGTLIMAEESTAWPQVTRPTYIGGLGFSLKWNMGWMHDTLQYMNKDPVHRHYHHNELTFGLLYAFTENFILPFSHDEVVHGKSSMLNKMPGDEWQKFANLRLLYSYMYTYPGKKLMFMGCEFGQGEEWNHDSDLDWYVLDYPLHQGVKRLLQDLNKLYCTESALHLHDFESQGFEWVDCNDSENSVLAYARHDSSNTIMVVTNFTPVPRPRYRIGVATAGHYCEILNSDSNIYGGSNYGNYGGVDSQDINYMQRQYSIELNLPPLAVVILKLKN